jgi:mannan endo-1,4-beta-mannosidase
VVSADSYPGSYNYTPQSGMFDLLVQLGSNRKLIAMTENGPIPDPELLKIYDAPWSWFCSWNQSTSIDNTVAHIKEVFNHPFVLTLDELPRISDYPLTSFTELNNLLQGLARSKEVGSRALPGLTAKLRQARDQESKGHMTQSLKHLDDFKKLLGKAVDSNDASGQAGSTLNAYADLLAAELSR